jgi:uncharacterized protein (DUF736 family)
MIIGNFSYDPAVDTYRGDFCTLAFRQAHMIIHPNAKSGDKEPDYRVILHAPKGPEIGAGWKRTSEGGKPFVSVVIDDPALPSPIHAALFLAEQENTARLVWSRSKKEPAAGAPKTGRQRRAPRPRPHGP